MYYPKFKSNSKDVPILSAMDIETIAEKFILDYDSNLLKKPTPIDIENFLEFYLELEMEYDDLSADHSCLGMTVFNNTCKIHAYDSLNKKAKFISANEGTVIIDNLLLESDQVNRLRFTLGHEAGHWVFHKSYYGYSPGQMSFLDLDNAFTCCRLINTYYLSKYRRTEKWDDEKWMEWQADKFSACLLMPEQTVRMCVEGYGANNEDIANMVRNISSTFVVSKKAAFYRLCDLGIVVTKSEADVNYQLSLFGK